MMPLSDVARIIHLGWDTVKSIVKTDLRKRYSNVPLQDATRIAIDEPERSTAQIARDLLFINPSGQNYPGEKAKFVTLVLDLDSGQVLWIGEGRGKAALEGFWPRLRGSNAKINADACAMSAAYWAAVIEHLPEAAIVFDHFHIVKLANEAIDEVRRGLQRTLDLIGCRVIKGTRDLLLRGKENLTPEQQPTLEEALQWNEPLSQASYLKEELRELWQQPDHASAASALQVWICKAMSTELGPMKRLAKTLLSHAKGVLNYFIHPICQHFINIILVGHLAALGCSGMMEGINNKIGRLTRPAYGYRDTLFLYLRILALHETKSKMSGL